jgi:hypothetical protein
VPRWDNAPQAHSRVSNINVDIDEYPMKNISRTAKLWAGTLPSLIYFSWDIYRDPLNNLFSKIKIDI